MEATTEDARATAVRSKWRLYKIEYALVDHVGACYRPLTRDNNASAEKEARFSGWERLVCALADGSVFECGHCRGERKMCSPGVLQRSLASVDTEGSCVVRVECSKQVGGK
ncbi:unnamed protein product [Gadus morhua 'NCC']